MDSYSIQRLLWKQSDVEREEKREGESFEERMMAPVDFRMTFTSFHIWFPISAAHRGASPKQSRVKQEGDKKETELQRDAK